MTAGRDNLRRRLALALTAATAVASLAGLGAAAGQSATERSATASGAATANRSATAGRTATASRTATERIVGFSYRPTPLRVRPGTRVVFVNRSAAAHTATRNGGGFDTGRIRPGKAARVTFKRRGTFRFHCTIHPFMRGRIVVR